MRKIKDIKQGDLFTFIAADSRYKLLLCTNIYSHKSPHYFSFCALNYDEIEKPTIEIIEYCDFFGVANATKNNFYNHSDEELEIMWSFHPEIKPYLLGAYNFIIWKKDFMSFYDNFEFIDNMKVMNNIDKNGNGSVNASSWDYLRKSFNEKFSEIMKERGQIAFRLKSIIRD
ncbi:hypothetical protein [Flavobacterium flavigenum]|uniref:hypothetical protein n=1 Tax=Flavobacterium flavigenum TaxID=3003258 RepID=UPI0022AC3C05|nr:hypothetical protein [Flavobacterium flavigenum]